MHDAPRIVNSVDRALTGQRLGNFCRHFFSERTPIVMVHLLSESADVDYIPLFNVWRYLHFLSKDMETYPGTGSVIDTLVRAPRVALTLGGLCIWSFQHRTFHYSFFHDPILGLLHLRTT